MAPNDREWTVPASVRALLWWPAAAFVLVLIAPDAAAVSIAAAGAGLAAIGGLAPVVASRLRARAARAADRDPPTVEMPVVEMPTVEFPPFGRAA